MHDSVTACFSRPGSVLPRLSLISTHGPSLLPRGLLNTRKCFFVEVYFFINFVQLFFYLIKMFSFAFISCQISRTREARKSSNAFAPFPPILKDQDGGGAWMETQSSLLELSEPLFLLASSNFTVKGLSMANESVGHATAVFAYVPPRRAHRLHSGVIASRADNDSSKATGHPSTRPHTHSFICSIKRN